MTTEDVSNLSNTVLRCEPCKFYNLTQLQCLRNKISGLFLVHFYTRSLVKNLNKITDWLNSSSIFPDVIATSETKLSGDKHTMVNIKGYSFIHKNSLTNAGGPALYIKSELMFRERPDLNLNDDDVEDLWVELFSPFKESIIVGTIYFHPNNSVNEFSRNLENTIIKLNNQRQIFYILGDFYINLLSDSRLTHAYLNSLTSLGVHCLINKPTRFMHNCTPSLLDHIYTNDNLHYLYPDLFPLDISDHLPSFLLIEFSRNKQHAPLWRRCYKNLNVDSFLFDLDDKLRRNLSNISLDTDSKFTLFLDTFIDVINTHSPLVKLSRRKTKLALRLNPG